MTRDWDGKWKPHPWDNGVLVKSNYPDIGKGLPSAANTQIKVRGDDYKAVAVEIMNLLNRSVESR